MKFEDIKDMWEEDGQFSVLTISDNGMALSRLHNKYFNHYVNENMKLKVMKEDLKVLKRDKEDYYRCDMSSEDLKSRGWEPFQKKILKGEVSNYIDSDNDVVNQVLKIGYQELIVEYLESIIKQINNRGYLLKTLVDFERFQAGA